jgi:hypothetical protein
MKKDDLIKNERNHARYLLFILEKINKIDELLSTKIKNKAI